MVPAERFELPTNGLQIRSGGKILNPAVRERNLSTLILLSFP
jgi:hypothetical protein